MAYKLYINNKLFNGIGNNNYNKGTIAINGTIYQFDNSSGTPTTDKNTIYFINTNGWSNVYVYAWKGSGGSGNQNSNRPGVKMTKTSEKVNGYEIWKYESTNFLTTWEKVIFSNGGSSQTSDITITTNCYDGSGTASTYPPTN